jgi:uncharacterized protein (DUF58 family)
MTTTIQQFLSKLYKYEIRIRKAVNAQMHGNFRSVFKGSGLEFSDLRLYQYGDDIRLIDWNTSAKGHGTFVKIFREEKEQTVFFMVDVSASQQVGSSTRSKLDTTKEICGVLALSAIKEASHVGMFCFSDQKEKYIKPANSIKHGYQIILELFRLKPNSLKTDLAKSIAFALNSLKRRSLVILISDFIDVNYEYHLKAMARKHDLVVIHLYDQRETNLPKLGIVPVFDTESRRTVWMNTSSSRFRQFFQNIFYTNQQTLEQLCREHKANYIAIDTNEDYVPKLIRLFKVRNRASSSPVVES